ncbi:hypothetical protein ABH945_002965 [Paraburkholderia sp. GAS333]
MYVHAKCHIACDKPIVAVIRSSERVARSTFPGVVGEAHESIELGLGEFMSGHIAANDLLGKPDLGGELRIDLRDGYRPLEFV